MRLEPEEIVAIKACALRAFGEGVKVYLYGSRVDDTKRGGDIDLLIEVDEDAKADYTHIGRFDGELQDIIGERRIDILVHVAGTPLRPIEDIAYSTGVQLL